MLNSKSKQKLFFFLVVGFLIALICIKVVVNDSVIRAFDESETQAIHLNLSNNWSNDSEHSYMDVNWSTNLTIAKDKYRLFRKSNDSNWQDITQEIDIVTETNDTSYQTNDSSNYFSEDLSVIDDVAPELPNVDIENNGEEFDLTISAKDKGREYEWYVSAEKNGEEIESSVKKLQVTSGIKGYIYTTDNSPTTSPSIERDSLGNIMNIMLDDFSSTLKLSKSENNWIHIVAVDFENNFSEVRHVELNESSSKENQASKFSSVSNRAAESVNFKIERTADRAKFTELALDPTAVKDMKSVEIRLPQNVSIENYNTIKLPTYWAKFQNSNINNMQSFTFSMESTVNDITMTNNSLSTITTFLNELNFEIKTPTNQSGQIQIIFHKLAYASWTDPKDNSRHYYAYVAPVGTSYLNWMQAYNEARKMEYRGLKGYLATLTSYDEHYFVYDRIAKHSGWLGGARMLKSNGQKINDDASIGTSVSNFNVNGTQWYWVNGPESGTVFFNRKTYAEKKNEIPNPNGAYQGFNNPLNSSYGGNGAEPNNSGNEVILEFAQASAGKNTMLWNDLGLTNTSYKSGYYVEFSEYGSQKETEEKTDISGSADIPQKIIINGYDQNGNAMPSSSNRLYDQKLVIGKKIIITPETFPMYDFIKLTDSNNTQLSSLELNISNSEQKNNLLYSLRKATINARQIIVNQNSEVVVPTKGFGKLESRNSSTSQIVGETTSISMKSSVDNNSSFESNVIRYDINNPFYKLTATIPMNYELIGYQTTLKKQAHTPEQSSLIPTIIDVSKNPEFWVTIYIKPVIDKPTQYNWDYKENNLSTIKVE